LEFDRLSVNLYSNFPKRGHHDIFTAAQPDQPLVISGVGNSSAKGYVVSDYLHQNKMRNILWLVNDNKDTSSRTTFRFGRICPLWGWIIFWMRISAITGWPRRFWP
jgi:hypothetical protein